MNIERDKKIKIILEDLYAIDRDFRAHENELKKIIERLLMVKPDVEFDNEFREKLRIELFNKITEIKDKKTIKGFSLAGLFGGKTYSFALGTLMLLMLIMIPTIYFVFLQEGTVPGEDNYFGVPEEGIPEGVQDRISTPASEEMFQLANPSSVYCEEQGGTLESRIVEAGAKGFCIFNDGSECAQWDFFRGDCKKGERFCKDLCGDDACQEIVCMAVGCPCAETPKSCPKDCK